MYILQGNYHNFMILEKIETSTYSRNHSKIFFALLKLEILGTGDKVRGIDNFELKKFELTAFDSILIVTLTLL